MADSLGLGQAFAGLNVRFTPGLGAPVDGDGFMRPSILTLIHIKFRRGGDVLHRNILSF